MKYNIKNMVYLDLLIICFFLQKNSLFSLRKLMRMFHDAVLEASDADDKESNSKAQYKVENPTGQ